MSTLLLNVISVMIEYYAIKKVIAHVLDMQA